MACAERVGVYRILTRSSGSNAFCVDRDETWTVVRDREFDSEDAARAYVLQRHRESPDFRRLTVDMHDHLDREAFLQQYADLTGPYLLYHRYFLAYPPLDLLKGALKADGVRVLCQS